VAHIVCHREHAKAIAGRAVSAHGGKQSMADLHVTTSYLRELAEKHVTSSTDVEEAANVTSGISSTVWLSHGVISGQCNSAVAEAAAARSAANAAMQAVAIDIAKKLRAAGAAYEGTDQQAGATIDKQMLLG
jgi:Excreted virulence factor EspC, type VII ESX diderm